jgi:molybdopterin synthase catalytic subunit
MRRVLIQEADFDAGSELGALGALGAGGVASFVGHVRGDGGLISLTLEHYPAMTSASLEALVGEAESRWPLLGVVIIHRVGRLVPGDQIVLAAAASAHRAAALEACAFLIDRLKTDAPFWKKEAFASGREHWVEARETDEAAATRWG